MSKLKAYSQSYYNPKMKILKIPPKRRFKELSDRVLRKFLCHFMIKMQKKPPNKRFLTLLKKAKQKF